MYDLDVSKNFCGAEAGAETSAEGTEVAAEDIEDRDAVDRHECELVTELGDDGASCWGSAIGRVASSWLIGGSETFCIVLCLCVCGFIVIVTRILFTVVAMVIRRETADEKSLSDLSTIPYILFFSWRGEKNFSFS